MAKVFFSYAQLDEADRDELAIHLAPLRREGFIESWHDRCIDAGEDFAGAIGQHLEEADVVLLLVSPYFLASNYCYDVEMRRALVRSQAGTARVIPVILNPCDWLHTPLGKLLAVPEDGKPISKFPNRHDGFLQVVTAIRKIVGSSGTPRTIATPAVKSGSAAPTVRREIRSSNLQVRKSFTDHDRDVFLEEAFDYIATYFENSLAELQQRNSPITTKFRRIDSRRFSAVIYRDGQTVAQCSVRHTATFGKGIAYSNDLETTNSCNEHLSVGDDGAAMFLTSMGMASLSGSRNRELTFEGGAEELWAMLIRPLQQ